MSGFVYILLSLKDNKTYVGSTNNLDRRISQHNAGRVDSTKNRTPLKIIYKEEYETLEEARMKERYYKSCAGRKKLKEIVEYKI